jgi:hypothetical protein
MSQADLEQAGGLPPPDGRVRISRGSIYLDCDLCAAYLADVSAVATIVREGRAYLLPLRGPAAGGLLLKIRNARGDRVVHAEDFLTALGVSICTPERNVAVRWVPDMAGLLLEDVASPNAN